MIIGFLNNQIDNRGTGNAVYDYAHYNEEILGNKSRIYTLASKWNKHDKLAVEKFRKRFGTINYITDGFNKLDVLYHIKSGRDDGFRTSEGIRYAVHGVFDYSPHGDRYAGVSSWLSGESGIFVPHIVSLPDTKDHFRREFGIDEEACVFGRYGGSDTFDIVFAWDAVRYILAFQLNSWFLFMNTDGAPEDIRNHPRVIFLPPTATS